MLNFSNNPEPFRKEPTKQANLKSTIDTLVISEKYVQIYQRRNQNDVNGVILISILLTLNISLTFFYCFYEQIHICCARNKILLIAKFQHVQLERKHTEELYPICFHALKYSAANNEIVWNVCDRMFFKIFGNQPLHHHPHHPPLYN